MFSKFHLGNLLPIVNELSLDSEIYAIPTLIFHGFTDTWLILIGTLSIYFLMLNVSALTYECDEVY